MNRMKMVAILYTVKRVVSAMCEDCKEDCELCVIDDLHRALEADYEDFDEGIAEEGGVE